MLSTVFFYKHSKILEEKLMRLNRCNKYQKVFIIEPIKITGFFNKYNYIFESNTFYVAIEYLNYRLDPFFKDTISCIQAQCFKMNYVLYQIFDVPSSYINIDVLLPFMPKHKILKKLKILMVSSELVEHGSYKITFSRKYTGNVESLLQNLHTDVEKYFPEMPILVSAFYVVYWLC